MGEEGGRISLGSRRIMEVLMPGAPLGIAENELKLPLKIVVENGSIFHGRRSIITTLSTGDPH